MNWRTQTIAAFLVAAFGQLFAHEAAAAHASCNALQLQLQIGSYSFNSGTQVQLAITVSKKGDPGCDYFVTISRGGAMDYNRKLFKGASTLPYQLYTGYPLNFVVKDIPEATSDNDVIPGSFQTKGTSSAVATYWAVLGNPAYLPWGLYQDVVTVKLYQGDVNGTYNLITSQSMSFSYQVAKAIDLSLVPSGAAFDPTQTSMFLDFGPLEQGKNKSFDVVMKYNAGYRLSIASVGQGTMRNILPSSSSTVPYTLSANGVAVDLSGGIALPATLSTGAGVSSGAGTRVPVTVAIGSTEKSMAGTYADVLFLVVTSTE